MRRLLACVFAFLLALQAGAALARSYAPCCDGCQDLAMCIAADCKACPAQAVLPAQLTLPPSVGAGPDFLYADVPADEAVPDIWRPPQ